MIFVVADDGVDPGLLRWDLAGRAFGEYLSLHLAPLQAEGRHRLRMDTRQPESQSEIYGYVASGSDLLVVAADAWFSREALEKFVGLVSAGRGTSRIVRRQRVMDEAAAPDILAVYLPAQLAKQLVDRIKAKASQDDIWKLVDNLSDYETTDPLALDAAAPPLRVTNLMDLAVLESNILYSRACKAILSGVRVRDPRRVSIRGELRCGSGVELDLDVIIEGVVELGDGVRIGANSIIVNSKIGANTRVNPFSIVEDSVIGSDSFVGPYGRVRPGSVIGNLVQIGNFVEIKNSTVGSGSRINHLAFIGDASLGPHVTIGAGTITCNHNGVDISRTQIESGAYVGSGTLLVAPLHIGENATIGAGSAITENAPAGKLTVARARQRTIEKWIRPAKNPLKK
jgi:UDP-N-acetylglucosamine diphosphorylase/glucosamine-1-phosphate N-acetyltransferase